MIGITTFMEPPEAALRMPVVTEKFVELACILPKKGLVISLCYNLVLVLICTFYAFKTRKLPDNFNESRYITFCVNTTLLIWLAFIPSYFTTSRAMYQIILLSLALILNGSVTLLCLYAPKIYAIYCGDKSQHTIRKLRVQSNGQLSSSDACVDIRLTQSLPIPTDDKWSENTNCNDSS